MAINEQYSYKDFTNQSFTERPTADFDNLDIYGSCFSHDGNAWTDVFPEGCVGIRLFNCNLDNVSVPTGTFIDPTCSQDLIREQNDLEDWMCDSNGNPVEPIGKKLRQKFGVSIDPNDIPSARWTEDEHEEFLKSMEYSE